MKVQLLVIQGDGETIICRNVLTFNTDWTVIVRDATLLEAPMDFQLKLSRLLVDETPGRGGRETLGCLFSLAKLGPT